MKKHQETTNQYSVDVMSASTTGTKDSSCALMLHGYKIGTAFARDGENAWTCDSVTICGKDTRIAIGTHETVRSLAGNIRMLINQWTRWAGAATYDSKMPPTLCDEVESWRHRLNDTTAYDIYMNSKDD